MLTSYKWRQAGPRDLGALSRAVHLPELKPQVGSSQVKPGDQRASVPSQERRESNNQLLKSGDTPCGLVRELQGRRGRQAGVMRGLCCDRGREEDRKSDIHKRPKPPIVGFW